MPIYLTSGSTWQVPSDWNSSANYIEAIGSGADGGGNVRAGGGGGAYSRSGNVTLTPGTMVSYSVAHIPMTFPGASTDGHTVAEDGGDAWFCNSPANCGSLQGSAVVVGAQGGMSSINGPMIYIYSSYYGNSNIDTIGGLGGQASAGIASGPGALKFSGGNGGNVSNMVSSYDPSSQPGSGGGAAGPHGDGLPGGSGAGMGGAADAGYGGGGGGLDQAGNNGSEWDASHGSGGGGGGASIHMPGTAGGNFGGGGGGGGNDGGNGYFGANAPQADASGVGGGGLIVITYQGTTCN